MSTFIKWIMKHKDFVVNGVLFSVAVSVVLARQEAGMLYWVLCN